MSKGASPKGATHICVSFHSASFIRGDLSKDPVRLLPGYIHKGGAYMIVPSECSVQSPNHWQCPQVRGQ